VHCARRCCWDPAAQVRAAAAKHLSDPALIQENINDHAVVRREINKHLEEAKGQKSVGTARHLEQQASLIGGMAKEGLIQDGCCYIEFGAGRGKLLHWLGQAAKELAAGGASAVPGQAGKSTSDYLAIDRSNTRLNFDRFHQNTPHSRLERVLIDIEHLVLGKVPLVQNSTKPLVLLGKHLCGAATDLSLTCSMQPRGPRGDPGTDAAPAATAADEAAVTTPAPDAGGGTGAAASKRRRVDGEGTEAVAAVAAAAASSSCDDVHGVMIALCCHQVCEWHRYAACLSPCTFSVVREPGQVPPLLCAGGRGGVRGEGRNKPSNPRTIVAMTYPIRCRRPGTAIRGTSRMCWASPPPSSSTQPAIQQYPDGQ